MIISIYLIVGALYLFFRRHDIITGIKEGMEEEAAIFSANPWMKNIIVAVCIPFVMFFWPYWIYCDIHDYFTED